MSSLWNVPNNCYTSTSLVCMRQMVQSGRSQLQNTTRRSRLPWRWMMHDEISTYCHLVLELDLWKSKTFIITDGIISKWMLVHVRFYYASLLYVGINWVRMNIAIWPLKVGWRLTVVISRWTTKRLNPWYDTQHIGTASNHMAHIHHVVCLRGE